MYSKHIISEVHIYKVPLNDEKHISFEYVSEFENPAHAMLEIKRLKIINPDKMYNLISIF